MKLGIKIGNLHAVLRRIERARLQALAAARARRRMQDRPAPTDDRFASDDDGSSASQPWHQDR